MYSVTGEIGANDESCRYVARRARQRVPRFHAVLRTSASATARPERQSASSCAEFTGPHIERTRRVDQVRGGLRDSRTAETIGSSEEDDEDDREDDDDDVDGFDDVRFITGCRDRKQSCC